MKISTNFDREEFACRCGNCGFDVVDVELLRLLEDVRRAFGPTFINSACRCDKHNRFIGGSKNSQHRLGKACDIITNRSPSMVYSWVDRNYPDKYGIGLYKTFVHIDVRKDKARWVA